MSPRKKKVHKLACDSAGKTLDLWKKKMGVLRCSVIALPDSP